MTTLWSPEAVAAYVGAVAASFVGAVAYAQTRSTARDGRDYDQRQANLRELRAATNAATSFKTTIVPELRTLDYYLDRARVGEPLPPLRVALSSRLDSMYGERMRSLPSAFEHVQAAYEGALGQVLRIDEILDEYTVSGSLPSGSIVGDHVFTLRSRVDSLDGLIEAARYDFSRIAPLPSGWDASFAVPPGRGRTPRHFGQ
ncbi:hypothetical protein [Streptomyces sp. NPDC050528]|uniref:hypothetical protein n=1 Tax=unclassified Streptomyces TaxID=2593676 RepID=UPI0037A16D25